jgi:peptidyl-prolyl cis-trans isomerase C
MTFKPAFRILVASIAVASAPAIAQNIAVVNGKAIPTARVDAIVTQVVAQGQQKDSPDLREMIKKDLVSREVLMQEAEKQGYAKSADVKQQMENARQALVVQAMVGDYVKKNPAKRPGHRKAGADAERFPRDQGRRYPPGQAADPGRGEAADRRSADPAQTAGLPGRAGQEGQDPVNYFDAGAVQAPELI